MFVVVAPRVEVGAPHLEVGHDVGEARIGAGLQRGAASVGVVGKEGIAGWEIVEEAETVAEQRCGNEAEEGSGDVVEGG